MAEMDGGSDPGLRRDPSGVKSSTTNALFLLQQRVPSDQTAGFDGNSATAISNHDMMRHGL